MGVLTFHRCINYGSYWQARGLVEGLRARGHDAVLLDYGSPIAETRVALRPTLPSSVSGPDIDAYKRKVRKFTMEFEHLPLSKPIDLKNPAEMERFDTVVIGSDEVWNLRHPWYSGLPAFWGEGLNAQRVVSYAASFGNYSCWEGLGSPFTDWLAHLDAISVRDENSWWMLRNNLGIEVETVLDPVLQFPLPSSGELKGFDGAYALVYGHNFSPNFSNRVREWADRRGVPLVSVGYRNDWADVQWLDAGPHEFAQAVAQSVAIATNFFHGCVFALQNAKPFACELSPYRSIKVRGLMELLGGERHLVPEDAHDRALDDLLDHSLDDSILHRIAELRLSSGAYLDRAVGSSEDVGVGSPSGELR